MDGSVNTNRDAGSGQRWEPTPGRRRPALWAAMLLVTGILIAKYLPLSPLFWAIAAFVALIGVLAFASHRPIAVFLSTLGVWLALGGFRYAAETKILPANHISHFLDSPKEVEVFAQVVDLPDRRENATNLTCAVRSVKQGTNLNLVSGRILVRVYDTTKRFSYGDYLRFAGRLLEPHVARNPGGFDYRQHLLDRGIYGMVDVAASRHVRVYPDPHGAAFFNRLIIPLREHILSLFREYVPQPGSALLAGYLIGETRDMPNWLYDAYRHSGILHLLAVSGSNVWLVLGMFWFLFRLVRLPRVVQTVLLLGILVVFCFATRNEPSVVRAGLMAALVLLAGVLHRRADLLNSVGVSAIIILLFSPRHVFLPGFQLSYAAVLGILLLVPRFQEWLPFTKRGRLARWLVTLIGSSVAATAATTPILAVHFGTIPVISVAANLVMVPLAALVTNGALVLVLLGDLWSSAANVVGVCVGWFAGWSIDIARVLRTIPVGQLAWPHPGILGIVNYLLIIAAVIGWRRRFRWVKFAAFYALVAAGVLVSTIVCSRPNPPGEVMFFDAGNDPLAGVFLGDGTAHLMGGAGAFSPSNRQWVIEPYFVSAGRPEEDFMVDTLLSGAGRFSLSQSNDSVRPAHQLDLDSNHVFRFVRFVLDSSSQPCVIAADYLAGLGSRVLVLYRDDPGLLRCICAMLPEQHIDVLAVAAFLPFPELDEIRGGLQECDIIVFGGAPGIASDALYSAWVRRMPGNHVWSTRRHGGVRVLLTSPVRIIPTIP